jgi:hypothetical protein
MTLQEIEDLWDLARIIHEARRDLAWGPNLGPKRELWPSLPKNYTHNPISYVDLALASAKAVTEHFRIDVSLAAGPKANG